MVYSRSVSGAVIGSQARDGVDDVLQGAQAGEFGGGDFGCAGEVGLECGEDFDLLDGVDAEFGFHFHAEAEHVGGVAGFLRHDRQDHVGGGSRGHGRCRCRCR